MDMEAEIIAKTEEELERIATKIFNKSQDNLIEPDLEGGTGYIISDTGALLQSGTIKKIGEMNFEIRYTAPYADFVEWGCSPHSAPVEPLIEWARRKLGKSEKEANSIGWAIRTKILQEGQEPKFFLQSAVSSVLAEEGLN